MADTLPTSTAPGVSMASLAVIFPSLTQAPSVAPGGPLPVFPRQAPTAPTSLLADRPLGFWVFTGVLSPLCSALESAGEAGASCCAVWGHAIRVGITWVVLWPQLSGPDFQDLEEPAGEHRLSGQPWSPAQESGARPLSADGHTLCLLEAEPPGLGPLGAGASTGHSIFLTASHPSASMLPADSVPGWVVESA